MVVAAPLRPKLRSHPETAHDRHADVPPRPDTRHAAPRRLGRRGCRLLAGSVCAHGGGAAAVHAAARGSGGVGLWRDQRLWPECQGPVDARTARAACQASAHPAGSGLGRSVARPGHARHHLCPARQFHRRRGRHLARGGAGGCRHAGRTAIAHGANPRPGGRRRNSLPVASLRCPGSVGAGGGEGCHLAHQWFAGRECIGGRCGAGRRRAPAACRGDLCAGSRSLQHAAHPFRSRLGRVVEHAA